MVAPFWPQRPWFPLLLRFLVGSPRVLPFSQGSGGVTPVLGASSQGEVAGFFLRVAQFSAEAFSLSTRDFYDSRLVSFREWCVKIPCDPTSAFLGVVADFLLSQF